MTNTERNEKILKAIRVVTKEATQSKESARAALIAEGVYRQDGSLTEAYGGKPKKAASGR